MKNKPVNDVQFFN